MLGNCIYSTCLDGEIQVHEYSSASNKIHLRKMYASENTKLYSSENIQCRPIHSMCVHDNSIFYGDDGSNVKVLDWQQGTKIEFKRNVLKFKFKIKFYYLLGK